MAEYQIPAHGHSNDDDATTLRHLMMVVGVLVLISFGLMGVVSVIV